MGNNRPNTNWKWPWIAHLGFVLGRVGTLFFLFLFFLEKYNFMHFEKYNFMHLMTFS